MARVQRPWPPLANPAKPVQSVNAAAAAAVVAVTATVTARVNLAPTVTRQPLIWAMVQPLQPLQVLQVLQVWPPRRPWLLKSRCLPSHQTPPLRLQRLLPQRQPHLSLLRPCRR